MDKLTLNKGDPIYVPAAEYAAALSLGATMVEGDARLYIPSILPDGVSIEAYSRWASFEARVIWIGEFLEGMLGQPVDLTDVAGIVGAAGKGDPRDRQDEYAVPLFVPKFEMDNVRCIPGVSWDRRRRLYVADRSADFGLIFPYLTPAMKSVWISEMNLDAAMGAFVKAKALMIDEEVVEGNHQQEMIPDDMKKASESE
jgi:hypothetical protein